MGYKFEVEYWDFNTYAYAHYFYADTLEELLKKVDDLQKKGWRAFRIIYRGDDVQKDFYNSLIGNYILVTTEVVEGCRVIEYYVTIDEDFNLITTTFLDEATRFINNEVLDNTIHYLEGIPFEPHDKRFTKARIELKKDEKESVPFTQNKLHLKYFQNEVHQNAVNHGWWDEQRSFGEIIALIHSELSEALEEYRNGKVPTETYYSNKTKPEGIPSELADVVIRVLDYCEYAGIDLEKAIIEKHEYNKSRPYKHGGKTI